MKIFLNRLIQDKKETLGNLTVFYNLKKVFECKTLEKPYINNIRNISCIPTGKYRLYRRWNTKHGEHLILLGVDGRSYILIHSGNTFEDTEGCILVGRTYKDINRDKELDITTSRRTLKKLMIVIDNFIKENPKQELWITISD